MWLSSLTCLGLLSVTSGLKVPSFKPPNFPHSTIDNDGVSSLLYLFHAAHDKLTEH